MPTKDYYLVPRNDTTLEAYEQHVVEIAVLLGANRQQAEIEMKNMVDFEIELAKVNYESFSVVNCLYKYVLNRWIQVIDQMGAATLHNYLCKNSQCRKFGVVTEDYSPPHPCTMGFHTGSCGACISNSPHPQATMSFCTGNIGRV